MNTSTTKTNKKKEDHADEFHYEILNHIGVLSTSNAGWKKELNIVKWNEANPKIDIRDWDLEHEKMSRGVSLNIKETEKLRELLAEHDFTPMMSA